MPGAVAMPRRAFLLQKCRYVTHLQQIRIQGGNMGNLDDFSSGVRRNRAGFNGESLAKE
jgi:hypothetical protein